MIATSSNTNLVPNDNGSLYCSVPVSGKGTVTIIPNLSLPPPSPGVPQAPTITLSVEDDLYVRQTTFLYIVTPANGSPTAAYSRPTGTYPTAGTLTNLANDIFLNGTMLNLQWDNSTDSLGSDHMTHTYGFSQIDDAIATIQQQNPFLDLSLDLPGDACYITDPQNPYRATQVWCDPVLQDARSCNNLIYCDPPTNSIFKRAVPWDTYLRSSRDAYLDAMNVYLTQTTSDMQYVEVVDTELPGIETGIRNAGIPFDSTNFPGYTREALLWAIQDELRTGQKDFPGKFIQIGFFKVTDNVGPSGTGDYPDDLWQWLYKDASATDVNGVPLYKDINGTPLLSLADEFNGVMRPRVSFFQEDLAAARTPIPPSPGPTPSSNAPNYSTPYSANLPAVATTAYTSTPLSSFIPSFAFYNGTLTNDTYNNGIVFQSNCPWSDPFMNDSGVKYTNTVNGSPNDALEAAFNTFHSEYLEIFPQDIDLAMPVPGTPQALNATVWASQLQSWHDYAASLRLQAPIEGPAGLNVTYLSTTQPNTQLHVTCYPVYGASSYTMDYRLLNGTPGTWANVGAGCDPTSAAGCTIMVPAGTEYGLRVAGQSSSGSTGAYSYAAMFLSEGANDGFISQNPMSYTNHATDPEPGILAGEPSSSSSMHYRGFLSFHTGDLGSVAVLGAKLRLKQGTSSDNFNPNNQCMVDIKNGYLGTSAGLDRSYDFNDTTATTTNAFSIIGADSTTDYWFEANLVKSAAAIDINLASDGRTQFRIYFSAAGSAGHNEGWYSGDSVGTSTDYPPQLLVRYQ